MKLGIGSYTFPWAVGMPGSLPADPLTAPGLLDKARELGVGVVQIADNMPLEELPDSGLDELTLKAREFGVEVELGMRGIGPDRVRRHLEIAKRLGSSILRTVILRTVVDHAGHEPSPEEIESTVRTLIPELEGAHVTLAIENHDRLKAATLAGIMRALDSPHVGICLDTVNSFGALEGPEVVVEALAPFTVNLHVKDFRIVRARSRLGFTIEGMPVGKGRLDVPWLLDRLSAHGRDVNAVIELWTPPEKTVEETIRKEADWARQSVEYLREFVQT